jgi:hypothetical protein
MWSDLFDGGAIISQQAYVLITLRMAIWRNRAQGNRAQDGVFVVQISGGGR